MEYLETNDDGKLDLRDRVETTLNVYLAAALAVLDALDTFVRFISTNARTTGALQEPLGVARTSILALRDASAGTDYEPAT
jgi:hypothetical protein